MAPVGPKQAVKRRLPVVLVTGNWLLIEEMLIEEMLIEKLAVPLPDDNVVSARIQPRSHPSEDDRRRKEIIYWIIAIPVAEAHGPLHGCRQEDLGGVHMGELKPGAGGNLKN